MGEEFGAATPFLYFCDFGPELAAAVRAGRRAEFAGFPPFDDEAAAQAIPDPGAQATAARSVLDWSSVAQDTHATWLALYRALLALRRARIVPLIPHVVAGAARYRIEDGRVLEVRWPLDDGRALLVHVCVDACAQTSLPRLPDGAECLWESPCEDSQTWAVRWALALAARSG